MDLLPTPLVVRVMDYKLRIILLFFRNGITILSAEALRIRY